MKASTRAPLNACRSALIQGLLRSAPGTELDENGYVTNASQNLIKGVRLADFEADLRQGDGNEMEGKFRAAHSSSALAVNTFAPFKATAAALRLPGGSGFASNDIPPSRPYDQVGNSGTPFGRGRQYRVGECEVPLGRRYQCNRKMPSTASSSAGLISLECATVTAKSGPSSDFSQNARKSFSAGKFGNIS